MSDTEQNWEDREPLSFRSILAPLTVEQFCSETSLKGPLHLPGQAGRFRRLLDWDGLARLLETHPLESPRLRIVKAGKPIAEERYLRHLGEMVRLDGGALSLLLDDGATVIINVIDDMVPAIAELADEAGDCLGGRPAVNLYANWRSDHGFNAHSDFHDVLVLQLAGRKQWTIHEPTRPDPLRGDAFEPLPTGAEPHSVEVLEDGDLLYVPRGWVHAPVPVGEPSMHLTISITRPTGAGFLAWLAREMTAKPGVRAAIPRGDAEALAEWKAEMKAVVGQAIEEAAVDRYLTHKQAQRTARPQLSFPDFGRVPAAEWDEHTRVRPSSQHRFMVETLPDGTGKVSVVGRSFPCSGPVAGAIAAMKSTTFKTRGELEAGLAKDDVAQLRQLLALFATFGLLEAKRG